MRLGLWSPVEYASAGLPPGWPAAGRHWSPERGIESLRQAFELYDHAVEAGFHQVSVAEHHGGYGSLTPSPIVFAAALAQRYPAERHPNLQIGILGPILPLANPIRVAEEIAMVDVLSGGRTVVGFFRGVPNEYLAYGTPPAAGGEMFREAFELVLRAWTEPEPFGWEGRHYRFRSISTWPRPLQQPHPPLVSGATTPEAAAWAGANGYLLGLFGAVVPPEQAAACVRSYREAAPEATADDVVYRARIYVAETDAEAETAIERYELGNMRLLVAPEPRRAEAAGKVLAALFGPQARGFGPPRAPRPEFTGSPATVLRQLTESQSRIGWGRLDCVFTFPNLPHTAALHSLQLFTTQVVPSLASTGA